MSGIFNMIIALLLIKDANKSNNNYNNIIYGIKVNVLSFKGFNDG